MSTSTYVPVTCASCRLPILDPVFTWTGTGMYHDRCVPKGNVMLAPSTLQPGEIIGWQWRRAGEPWPEKLLNYEPALTAPDTEKRAVYAGPVVAYGVGIPQPGQESDRG